MEIDYQTICNYLHCGKCPAGMDEEASNVEQSEEFCHHGWRFTLHTLQKLMGKSDPKFWVKTTATQITHYKGNSNLQNTLAKQP